MSDSESFQLHSKNKPVERISATFYTSDLYRVPMTPEYIAGATPGKWTRGQAPYGHGKWNAWDGWLLTNHFAHRHNDKITFCHCNGWRGGVTDYTIEHQPNPKTFFSLHQRTYDDDIIGQMAGGVLIGCQLGMLVGLMHTFNVAKEANIFQSVSMPANRWIPMHKVDLRLKIRIWGTCMAQMSSYLAGYALVDGVLSKLRGKDDIWNNIWGGFGAGTVAWAWYRNPLVCIGSGFFFGLFMGWVRFAMLPEHSKKPALDFDRPGWGVFGGMGLWLSHQEPDPDKWWYQWIDKKYRI